MYMIKYKDCNIIPVIGLNKTEYIMLKLFDLFKWNIGIFKEILYMNKFFIRIIQGGFL